MLALALLVGTLSAAEQSNTRVSVNSQGAQVSDLSYAPSMSGDGRFVTFSSDADDLVLGDTNGEADVFVHDLRTRRTTRVSVDSAGGQGNGRSASSVISADGRWVAFGSAADNLVVGDSNGIWDAFVHDRGTGRTERVSVNSWGLEANGVSKVSAITADGSAVAFTSAASNLVAGDSNGANDVFFHDRVSGITSMVSVSSLGTQGDRWSDYPSLSADGRYVSYGSASTNLVPGDLNGMVDIFVHDRFSGQTTTVSVSSSGTQGNALSWASMLSADGRTIAFDSKATNLVSNDTNGADDVFVHDRLTGVTTRVSVDSHGVEGNGQSLSRSVSAEGRFVAIYSNASNLVPGDTNQAMDVFVHDRWSGLTTRVSADVQGGPPNESSAYPALSADGRFVVMQSRASNLVPGDTNGVDDIFVRDRGASRPVLLASGPCPGATTVRVFDATAGSLIALLHGSVGTTIRTTPPCTGLVLDLASPTLGLLGRASTTGRMVRQFNFPPAVCGRVVQAVDMMTCVASNYLVL